MNPNRDFKGVWIPKETWLNKELTWMEKIFFVEIDSLDNENGCFASNNYFADFFMVTPQRCSQVINSLIKKRYVKATYEREGKRVIKRVLNIFDRGIKYSYKGSKYPLEGYKENVKENNTLYNTTKNNTLLISLVNHWNDKDPLKTNAMSTILRSIKKKHTDILNDLGEEVVKKAIDNYAEIIPNDSYYFNHRWNLWDFIARGIDNFTDEARPHDNYLKDKSKQEKDMGDIYI